MRAFFLLFTILLSSAWIASLSLCSSHTQPHTQTEIVFWGNPLLTDQILPALKSFEQAYPQYKVRYSVPVTKDLAGDAQRLLCSIVGNVPPDVVFFDRFAIGEWAARGAFENLTPWIKKQNPKDPLAIALEDFYPFALQEASYSPPHSKQKPQLYGLPTSVDFRLLFLHSDLLRQEGLLDANNLPRPPANWQELRNYSAQLTRFKDPNTPSQGLLRVGFAPNIGDSWLYLYAWQAGGSFLNETRDKITLTSPPVVKALAYMTTLYDDLGGFSKVEAFQSNFQYQGASDPFISGQIAMKIDGTWALDRIAAYSPHMDFLLSPPPLPQDAINQGRKPLTWSGGFAYVMPKSAKQKEGAFRLIQFLLWNQTLNHMEEAWRVHQESQGRLYLPRACAKRQFFEKKVQEAVFDNPHMPATFKRAYATILAIAPSTQTRPVTPIGQFLWNKHLEAYQRAVTHNSSIVSKAQRAILSPSSHLTGASPTYAEAYFALQSVEPELQNRLDSLLSPPRGNPINPQPWLWGYAALCLLPFCAIALSLWQKKHRYNLRETLWALGFASPWIIGMVVFVGGPILFSILLSFTEYSALSLPRNVGLSHYTQLLHDPLFYKSLLNTLFMLLRVPLSLALGLALALLLKKTIRGMGCFRTLFYLPTIMPIVAASYLWFWLLSDQNGLINLFLNALFDTLPFQWVEQHLLGFSLKAPAWFQEALWTKPALIIMHLWTAGSSMIIWLAGLQAIPQNLYEAARIDGASHWKQFTHITLPLLTPYVLFNLIMGSIATLQLFSEAFILTQGGPENATLFYAYYLFKQGFQYFRIGYASALAWVLFIIVFLLTLIKLYTSKRWVYYQGD